MKKPIERYIYSKIVRNRLVTIILYKMDNGSYEAFAYINFDTDEEIIGTGEAEDRETAIKLAINDLFVEIRQKNISERQ